MLKWLVFEVGEVNGHKYKILSVAFGSESEARRYMDKQNSICKDCGLDTIFVVQEAEQAIGVPDIWEGLEDGEEN